MPSLASLTFDASGFSFQGEHNGAQVWLTPAGDELGVFYSVGRSDLDLDARSLDSLRLAIRYMVSTGRAIVEVEAATTDCGVALRQIIKAPQQPHGMIYVGSLVLPFRDFTFVIKVQCHEHGTTGMRDTIVLEEALVDGRVTIDPAGPGLTGWMHDPYDATLDRGFLWNLSEASEYDVRFPDHPLSRVRAVLDHLARTLRVTQEVGQSSPYVLTGGAWRRFVAKTIAWWRNLRSKSLGT